MPLSAMVLSVLAAFAVAYAVYGRLLSRLFGLSHKAQTPAHACEDGEDFVPTKKFYLLSQHFSAISAAGPIAGPILAASMFGWEPAFWWIVLGCIFIGSMHDFAALVGSMRHGACSIAGLLRSHLNGRSYAAFSLYIWLALVYLIIAFTDVTARAFVEALDVSLPAAAGGRIELAGAGVASSSMLYLLLSVLMGLCVRYGRWPLWLCTAVFVPLVGLAIWAGPRLPIDLSNEGPIPSLTWAFLILGYCAVASVLPVWSLLQPRGYLGGFFLYITLLGGLLGLVLWNPEVTWPSFLGAKSSQGLPLMPFLFITIACGACSGFHGLVCSGTTSKQVDQEPDAHLVGYGGMLLEGIVAVLALACVMILSPGSDLAQKPPDKIFGIGIGQFLHHLGVPLQFAVTFGMLAFATFVYDTLDVCTRLARFLFTEFTGWRTRTAGLVGTLLTLALPAVVVCQTVTTPDGKTLPAYMAIWPLFGSTNQLLAGLTLAGLLLWLAQTRKPRLLQWLVAIPMGFMMTVTTWALCLQILRGGSALLVGVAVVLLALALFITMEALWALLRDSRRSVAPQEQGTRNS